MKTIKDAIEHAEAKAQETGQVYHVYKSGQHFAVMSDSRYREHKMVRPVYNTRDQRYANKRVDIKDGQLKGFVQ